MMIILTIIIILLIAVISYLGYRLWYLAGQLADAQEYMDQLEMTNEYMYAEIINAFEAMREIDQKGAFEKDDEAGTTFEMLSRVIENLKNTFDGTSEEEI